MWIVGVVSRRQVQSMGDNYGNMVDFMGVASGCG